jgi:hypothetical protein
MPRDFHLQREGLVMKHWTVGTGITLAALMMGSTAFAEVTPEDLWAKFQEFSANAGQSVATDSVARNGDTLEIRGLKLTATQAGSTATQSIPEVNFKDNGDGTVGITMSETIPLVGTFPIDPANPGGGTSAMDMQIVQSGLLMTASGTADAPFIDFTAASMTAKGTMTDPSGPTTIDMSIADMKGGYAFSENDFQYNYGTGAGKIGFSNASMPFPIDIGFGAMAFDMKFPLKTSADPVPFTFAMKLSDFTLPDAVWGMADPTGQLPHDPATLIIDTAGSMRLLADFTATPAAGEVPPPPEVSSVSIKEIRLKLIGAELAGNGDLTLDNTDTTTFSGMPAPTGTLNFTLTGGNGVLDKLAAMGLVPEDQLMGVRMMMGMFATMATDGSDSMTSKVEFRDKGLYVNGQQLQ